MFGIKSRHIAALLDIANDISDDAGVVADSDRNKRELLKQRLKRCMTQDILAVRAILDNDHDILESIGSLTNKRVIDLLLDEHTSLDLFRYLKQYAAELSRSAENEAERHAMRKRAYKFRLPAHSLFTKKKLRTSLSVISQTPSLS